MITLTLPDDPLILAAVGKIALRHGQLDHILRMTVKSLTEVTIKEAIDATARQGSRELRNRVHKLARQRIGEGKTLIRLEAILERARIATERRNELLHSLWAHELDGDAVIHDKNHAFQPIPSAQELEAAADELRQIASELNFARLEGFLAEALKTNNG